MSVCYVVLLLTPFLYNYNLSADISSLFIQTKTNADTEAVGWTRRSSEREQCPDTTVVHTPFVYTHVYVAKEKWCVSVHTMWVVALTITWRQQSAVSCECE